MIDGDFMPKLSSNIAGWKPWAFLIASALAQFERWMIQRERCVSWSSYELISMGCAANDLGCSQFGTTEPPGTAVVPKVFMVERCQQPLFCEC